MSAYLVVFAVSVGTTFVLTPLVRRLAIAHRGHRPAERPQGPPHGQAHDGRPRHVRRAARRPAGLAVPAVLLGHEQGEPRAAGGRRDLHADRGPGDGGRHPRHHGPHQVHRPGVRGGRAGAAGGAAGVLLVPGEQLPGARIEPGGTAHDRVGRRRGERREPAGRPRRPGGGDDRHRRHGALHLHGAHAQPVRPRVLRRPAVRHHRWDRTGLPALELLSREDLHGRHRRHTAGPAAGHRHDLGHRPEPLPPQRRRPRRGGGRRWSCRC